MLPFSRRWSEKRGRSPPIQIQNSRQALQFRASNGDAKNIENYWCFHICPPLPISRLSKQVEKVCGTKPWGCCQGQGQGRLPRRKQRRRRLWGVSNFVQNGAYMGIPVHHKIATKMGDHDPTDIIYTDIGVLHFQTNYVFWCIFKCGIQTIRLLLYYMGIMKGHKMNISGMSGFVQRLGITFVPKYCSLRYLFSRYFESSVKLTVITSFSNNTNTQMSFSYRLMICLMNW